MWTLSNIIFKDSSQNWSKTMHFKILEIHFLEEISGKKSGKVQSRGIRCNSGRSLFIEINGFNVNPPSV